MGMRKKSRGQFLGHLRFKSRDGYHPSPHQRGDPGTVPPKPTSNKISTTIAEQDDRETNRILDTSG
jgi:hypothetical protein